MQLTPEMKAQINEQKKNCVYCKITSKEISAKTVFSDNKTEAVLDIYPAVKGHVVYFLKEHYPITPYIPPEDSRHFFGLIPQLCKQIQKGMVTVGMNVLISSGNAAGQLVPHVLVHLLPRDEGDGFYHFMFKKTTVLNQEKKNTFQQYFPLRMSSYFKENPASWHHDSGDVPEFLTDIYQRNTVIYEDEKLVCIIPEKGAVEGHLEIYSKIEQSSISKLSIVDSIHLFSTASLASSLVFEAVGAQGTNIIVKSGKSDDNPQGRLSIHILPRFFDDKLKELTWEQKQPSYNLDGIYTKIKDAMWPVKYVELKELPEITSQKDSQPNPPVNSQINVQPNSPVNSQKQSSFDKGQEKYVESNQHDGRSSTKREQNHHDEIREAIDRLKQ